MNANKSFTLYMHKNIINGKVYIGITSRKMSVRSGKNGCNYIESPRFWNAIQKYGWQNFSHHVQFDGLSQLEAESMEIEYIERFKSNDPQYGYNIGSGGDGSHNITEEGRERIRLSKLGDKNPNYGKKLSQERVNQLKSLKPMLGKHHTDEAKQRMSEIHKGRFMGAEHWRSKRVLCVETNIVYGGVRDAGRKTGLGYTQIGECCRGRLKTYAGYHWKYVEANNNINNAL